MRQQFPEINGAPGRYHGTISSPIKDTYSPNKPDSLIPLQPELSALAPTDETVSHEQCDDRLGIHYFSAIDHTQSALEGM